MPRPSTVYSNFLIIECAVDPKHIHRQRWKVVFRPISGEKIQIHRRGSPTSQGKGTTYLHNMIVIDPYINRETFIKTLKRHFSLDYSVEPKDITLEFENYLALWGEPKQ